MQSKSRRTLCTHIDVHPSRPHRTSAEWIECFRPDKPEWRAIDFTADPGVTREELTPLLRSLQAWQLGETSEARHLRAVTGRYAARVGDPDLPAAMELFIREEQTHGEALGKFLDAVGAPRLKRDPSDCVFRFARGLCSSMEVWTTVVLMIETMALIFYRALKRATPSPLLRAICDQILRDEGPHLRFQYERLAIMHARRPRLLRHLTYAAQRMLFAAIVTIAWFDNRRLFRAGGYSFRRYRRQAWRTMRFHWSQIEPKSRAATARGAALREAPSRLNGWLH